MQDPTMQCFTKDHNRILPSAYVSLVLILGVPILVPFGIWYCKQALLKEKELDCKKLKYSVARTSRSKLTSILTNTSSNQTHHIEDNLNNPLSIARDAYDGLYFFLWKLQREVLLLGIN